MTVHEMEYKGLNLLDEVCTVEIAIDEPAQIIHIFDTNHVVEPTYHFTKKMYELSEGFSQLVEVLRNKYYFQNNKALPTEQWIEDIKWVFYSSNQSIKCYEKNAWLIYFVGDLPDQATVYNKYVERLK